MTDNLSQKQKEQRSTYRAECDNALETYPSGETYEYKGYEPERKDMPEDVKMVFDYLNTRGLGHHRDPLCVDMYYTKNKYRFSVVPEEKRAQGTPQEIERSYQNWYVGDWKQRSRIHKIFSILWYLPAHFYRKYLTSLDYRWYYNGLVSFLGRARNKIKI